MKRNNKLIFTISQLSGGGAENVMIMLSNYFSERGYEVFILVTNQSEQKANKDKISDHVNLYFLFDYLPRIKIPFSQKAVGLICDLFEWKKKMVPDFWAKKSFYNVYNEYVDAMCRFLSDKQDYTVVAFLQPSSQIAMAAVSRMGNRIFLSERTDPIRYFKSRYAPYFLKNFYSHITGMVFQTENAMSEYRKYIDIPRVVIANPIPAGLPEPFEGQREKRIVNFCRLSREKNIHLLLDAFEDFSNDNDEYSLEIYGDGILKFELESYSKTLSSADRIHFYPFSEDIHSKIHKASMFVSSSDYEGMSNSMLEAMAIGLPVICTDCPIGGARAVITDHENGILVPVNDKIAMSNALRELADDVKLSKKIGRNAAKIRGILNEQSICRKWEDFIFNIKH